MKRCLSLSAIVIAALAIAPYGLGNYGIYLLSLWALYSVAAVGLNLTLGLAGQVSIAQAAFLGIGAYISALMTVNGIDFWVTLPLAGGTCFVIGILLGIPALRVQHHYLAFVTLGFNTLVFLVLRNETWLTGGTYGLSGINRPHLFGIDTNNPVVFFHICLVFMVAMGGFYFYLSRSPWGRAFKALRENPVRAASLGIDVRTYTLLAFAIGASYAGFAGAFYAPLVEYIDPLPFALNISLALLLMVIVGGAGYFAGPFLGAAVVTLLPEWLRVTEGYYLMVYAILVMVLMAVCPTGLCGLAERLTGWVQQKRTRERKATAP